MTKGVQDVNEVTIFPLGYYVAIEVKGHDKSKGGIILPTPKQKDQKWGKVIAVGEGDVMSDGLIHAIPLKIGDLVCLRPGAGYECTVHKTGKEIVLVNWREILFALRGPSEEPLGDSVHS